MAEDLSLLLGSLLHLNPGLSSICPSYVCGDCLPPAMRAMRNVTDEHPPRCQAELQHDAYQRHTGRLSLLL